MPTTEKKNRNYQKTEKAIKNALIKLYKQKKDINKITVKELCEVANISRSTFYLHYNDLISIFESVGDIFVNSLKGIVLDINNLTELNFLPPLELLLNLLNESNALIKIGLSSEYPLAYIVNIKDDLEKLIVNSPVFTNTKYGPTQTLAEIRIVVSGLIDFIIDLIRKNDYLDVGKYSEILNHFLTRWTSTLI